MDKHDTSTKDKIIFLDVDGVLNGANRWNILAYHILYKVGLRKWARSHIDIFGVHKLKVRRLSKIVEATGAKVVISSTWRSQWYIPYEDKHDRDRLLEDMLRKYNIEVVGITGHSRDGNRGKEILEYLSVHEDHIGSFVILDDESEDIAYLFSDKLVQTTINADKGYTGLNNKHVREAVRILNEGGNNDE